MIEGLPRPADILDELGEKVIEQVGRLSTNGFDAAFEDMVRYHRFLLEAYGTKTDTGQLFSYAEVTDWFSAPHEEWTREYRRLFERAVNAIAQDGHFLSHVSDVPIRLLSGLAQSLSARVTESILDLGLIGVGRIENWKTRHSVGDQKGSSLSDLTGMAGSDKIAYGQAALDFIGSWEGLLQFTPSLYRWQEDDIVDEQKWDLFEALGRFCFDIFETAPTFCV